MKYYAVIDTNVLVSAMLKWNSIPGTIINLVFDGPVIPVFSEEILEEYKAVLSRPKFHLDVDDVNDILDGIVQKGIMLNAENTTVNLPDPKDVVFYEVVLEKRKSDDTYLVTGNIKHFPTEPFIVTPREFIDIIIGNITDYSE